MRDYTVHFTYPAEITEAFDRYHEVKNTVDQDVAQWLWEGVTGTLDRLKELHNHIEAENAKGREEGNCFSTVSDPNHWVGYGVWTVEQYLHYCDAETYIDLHNYVYGFKPRGQYPHEWSQEDLDLQLSHLFNRAEEENRLKEEAKAEALQRVLDAGAPDEETAKRWLFEATDEYPESNVFNREFHTPNEVYRYGLSECY